MYTIQGPCQFGCERRRWPACLSWRVVADVSTAQDPFTGKLIQELARDDIPNLKPLRLVKRPTRQGLIWHFSNVGKGLKICFEMDVLMPVVQE